MTKPLEYTTFFSNPEFYRLAFQRTWPALVGVKNRVHFNFWGVAQLKLLTNNEKPLQRLRASG